MKNHGYTLIEMILVIVIIGILASVAVRSLKKDDDNRRFDQTAEEMNLLARAIVGNERLISGGIRTDFGYVGDVGALPSSLDDLVSNPGGYSTWNGPYFRVNFNENTDDYKRDAWNQLYTYSGGVTIVSNGGGSSFSKQFANSTGDLTSNTIKGIIRDLALAPPGDSASNVTVTIQYPDGSGSVTSSSTSPTGAGEFSFDNSMPVGLHLIRAVVSGVNDTTSKYIAINPGSVTITELRFAANLWGGTTGGGGSGTMTLRPDGTGSSTGLVSEGCSSNWECVDELSPDGDITRVKRPSNSYATDLYTLQDPSDTSYTITGVTVYVRARKYQTQGGVKPLICTGGATYEGTEQSLTQSYEDYSHEWTTNPGTSAAWTWQQIFDLEAGLDLKGQNATKPGYATQLWIVISYSS